MDSLTRIVNGYFHFGIPWKVAGKWAWCLNGQYWGVAENDQSPCQLLPETLRTRCQVQHRQLWHISTGNNYHGRTLQTICPLTSRVGNHWLYSSFHVITGWNAILQRVHALVRFRTANFRALTPQKACLAYSILTEAVLCPLSQAIYNMCHVQRYVFGMFVCTFGDKDYSREMINTELESDTPCLLQQTTWR